MPRANRKHAIRWLVRSLIGSALIIAILPIAVAGQEDWPNCTSGGCVASDLTITRVYIDAAPCGGATRSGILKAELSASSTRYNIRIAAQVYVVSDGVTGYLESVEYCWPGAYTGTQTITLDSNVVWDCDASLELWYTLVSWQIQSDSYICASTLPCSAIAPKCNGDYYDQKLEVEGSESPNQAPMGANSLITMNEDAVYAFQLSDFGYSDADGDPLAQVQITELETVGSLKLGTLDVTLNQVIVAAELSAGNLTYAPLPNETGSLYDSFRFKVHDGTEYSTSDYPMSVAVTPVNDPPEAADDSATTDRSTSVLIAVLDNDTDPEDDVLTVVSISEPAHGQAMKVGDSIRYFPEFFYLGADTFDYVVQDAGGLTDTGTVSIQVLSQNTAPTAMANGPYDGMVGDEIALDALFSTDADIQDTLEYRWDINGDGEWDSDWIRSATFNAIYERPYRGTVTLEVRDLYYGVPNGTSAIATSLARIIPKPTQIAISIFVDLNGNDEFDEGDVGLPGVSFILDAVTEHITAADGTILLSDVAPGLHTMQISGEGAAYLAQRGFFLPEESLETIDLEAGEWVALFFSPEARGFLEIDLGAESNDEE